MQTDLRDDYLQAMGIQQWVARTAAPAETEISAAVAAPVADVPPADAAAPAGDSATLDWPALEARVAGCTQCDLHRTRSRTVFGTGDKNADWLIIGEAPGGEEDRAGEPFVGRAGQLLTEILNAGAIRRADVYITNIIKCRPPNNRDPHADEMTRCHAYLERQIELLQPRLILAVGRIAAHHLLQTDIPVGRLRGTVHHYGPAEVPLIVTYHPAYLLRTPLKKREVWADLQLAQNVYREAEGG